MDASTLKPQNTSELIQTNAALWWAATHHPFLNEIQKGTLAQGAFSTWLVQDYHFAGKLLAAQSLILSNAPRADQEVLIGGLVALESELRWFEENGKRLNLDLTRQLMSTCRAYGDFLLALPYEAYTVQITSLWALERAYLDAWATALPCEPKYREFVEHWTVPEFHDYVSNLEAAANRALSKVSAEERVAVQESFHWVARYERDFWEMAFGD